MSRLLRDPLLHFLLLGLLIFAWGSFRGAEADTPRRVVVSEAQQARLAETFRATWNRAPTEDELARLVDAHIDEEVLVREATALGLDADDPVIRRRLVQKMELLTAELADMEPTDAELQALLDADPDAYRGQPQLTFTQAPPEGAPATLPEAMTRATLRQVAARFGSGFARELQALPPDGSAHILPSTFGDHTVRLTALEPAPEPTLERLRDRLREDWRAARASDARARAVEDLRARYRITVQ